MNSLILKIFTKSPSAKSGGKILNFFGYSLIKSIFFFLFEKFRKSFKPSFSEKYKKYLIDLEREGFTIIDDFLGKDDFEKLKDELNNFVIKNSKNYNNSFSIPLMTMLENKLNSKILEKYFFKKSEIYSLICYLSGLNSYFFPTIEYNYLKSKRNDRIGFEDGQHNLHYDVTYSSYKAILYLEDTDKENGAFEYLKGSHKFNLKRLKLEYLNSLSKDRTLLTKLVIKNLKNIISLGGKKNSLIIMNAKGMHRRGLFYKETTRSALFIDFRFLHTLGNFLPKRFLKNNV